MTGDRDGQAAGKANPAGQSRGRDSRHAQLRHIADAQPKTFALGFFGDPMQKIYTTGIGVIHVPEKSSDWSSLAKPENFRSSLLVLGLINSIRASAGDQLIQESGLAAADQSEGELTFVVLPNGEDRSATLKHTLQWLRDRSTIGAWDDRDHAARPKILVIAHRMAARRLGFDGLYEAFHASQTLSDAFDEGTAWPLTPFRETLLPLAEAASNARGQLIPLLLKANPALRDRAASDGNTKELLAGLSKAVSNLLAIVEAGGAASVGDALRIADSEGLVELDTRLRDALVEPASSANEALDQDQRTALSAYLQCDVREVRAYLTYLEVGSPYSTQQGIKGAEFPDVLVVLDDEEGNYSLFSYDKLLKLKPLSKTDLKRKAAGDETVLARTWRLLYVCASRARRALAIVLYAADVDAAVVALRDSELPGTDDIWTLENMIPINNYQSELPATDSGPPDQAGGAGLAGCGGPDRLESIGVVLDFGGLVQVQISGESVHVYSRRLTVAPVADGRNRSSMNGPDMPS